LTRHVGTILPLPLAEDGDCFRNSSSGFPELTVNCVLLSYPTNSIYPIVNFLSFLYDPLSFLAKPLRCYLNLLIFACHFCIGLEAL
jgi:hypothetical protein